ncbi:mechanosensitive ion channel [Candidatus Bathyarchaeota archaeon]|nr:mechanosensitive ion channel [Candidatus Bathyarchaeota archaeon]
MLESILLNLSDYLTTENLFTIAYVIAIIILALIIEGIIGSSIKRYTRRIEVSRNLENILQLVSRVVISFVAVVAILQVLGLGVEWLLSLSAVAGVAVGFASTQTLGNFLAGVYIIVSQPFTIEDYIRIGDIEGEVKGITLNYTEIYNTTYNLVAIPNKNVLDSNITNYILEDMIDYSFEVRFPHDPKIDNKEIVEKCISPAIEEFSQEHAEILPRKPEYGMSSMGFRERGFLVRVFFRKGHSEDLYDYQPLLLEKIVFNWDRLIKEEKIEGSE